MTTDAQRIRPGTFADGLVPVVIVSLLIFLPAMSCLLRGDAGDPDVWWHLKTGQWILEHGALPTEDAFSSLGQGNAWTAYSWTAEVMLAGLHRALGLRGLVLFTAALAVAIVAAFYNLLRRMQPNPLVTYALTLAAVIGLVPLLSPRPWLFSILFFIIELDLLLTAGRTGNRRLLWWLVPLFCLWANVHIQFTMGLAILGLAVAESVAVRAFSIELADDDSRRVPPAWMLLVFVACAAATLVNPYGWRLYAVAVQLVGQAAQLRNVIDELQAMSFRISANWLVLAVALGAAFAMGWRRKIRLLLPLLFVMAAYFSFQSERELWFVLLVGLTSLAYVCPRTTPLPTVATRWSKWATAAAVSLMIAAVFVSMREPVLQQKVAAEFPAEAVRFVREQLADRASTLAETLNEEAIGQQPLFNSFGWGGYLMVYLPELPVSIDGRTIVHGQDRVMRHADTLGGKQGWRDDPELRDARLVILPHSKVLASLLRLDPQFGVAYEDDVAIVFLRGEPSK